MPSAGATMLRVRELQLRLRRARPRALFTPGMRQIARWPGRPRSSRRPARSASSWPRASRDACSARRAGLFGAGSCALRLRERGLRGVVRGLRVVELRSAAPTFAARSSSARCRSSAALCASASARTTAARATPPARRALTHRDVPVTRAPSRWTGRPSTPAAATSHLRVGRRRLGARGLQLRLGLLHAAA